MAEETSPASRFADEHPAGNNRAKPGISGVGKFGIGIFPHGAKTRYLWQRVKRAIIGLFLVSPAFGQADTFTSTLLLRKPAVGVEDTVTPWGDKHNSNMDILEAAICDKRVGCTISGPLVILGTFTAPGFLTSTGAVMTGTLRMSNTSFLLTGPNGFITGQSSITASAFFGSGIGLVGIAPANISPGTFNGAFTFNNNVDLFGVTWQGNKTNAEIRSLTCAAGNGRCVALSTDEADVYVSTGSLAGQYRNNRTGKGP